MSKIHKNPFTREQAERLCENRYVKSVPASTIRFTEFISIDTTDCALKKRDSALCTASRKPDPVLMSLPSVALSPESVKPNQYITPDVS